MSFSILEMDNAIIFVINGIMLGTALAMDAFSVSIVNGLNESGMSRKKTLLIPFTFAFFQFVMPLIGYFLVSAVADAFNGFRRFIPVIALILLLYIGGKMLIDSIVTLRQGRSVEYEEGSRLDMLSLILQGIATSIDALSVGFTISDYDIYGAVMTSFIIALVTFFICLSGIIFGKKIGGKISNGAGILGGIILIIIGIRVFIRG